MQDPTIDYSLQRLSKMIPKHADDPDRLSKVFSFFFLKYLNSFEKSSSRKQFSNVQLTYSNNATPCQEIHIISLCQHRQVTTKMIQVHFLSLSHAFESFPSFNCN